MHYRTSTNYHVSNRRCFAKLNLIYLRAFLHRHAQVANRNRTFSTAGLWCCQGQKGVALGPRVGRSRVHTTRPTRHNTLYNTSILPRTTITATWSLAGYLACSFWASVETTRLFGWQQFWSVCFSHWKFRDCVVLIERRSYKTVSRLSSDENMLLNVVLVLLQLHLKLQFVLYLVLFYKMVFSIFLLVY